MASRRTRPQLSLGRDDRLMTWSSSLNIYRVNRFNVFDLDLHGDKSAKKQRAVDAVKFDLIEGLLCHNMVDTVETIFYYVGLETVMDCLLVCRLWYDFLSCHLFKRWAEQLVGQDSAMRELALAEKWTDILESEADENTDCEEVKSNVVYRRICCRIFELREVWRFREPKLRRLQNDSFVLCLKFIDDLLYCGLNNGFLQLWDLDWSTLRREQEIHEKGVKCIDINEDIIATGSYDCTCKIWSKSTWTLLQSITLHNDSVWDLKLLGDFMVTAGLDGTVGMYTVHGNGEVDVLCLMQANEDMVSSVDFDEDHLVTGYEDSHINVWDRRNSNPGHPLRIVHTLLGHGGGVTGLSLNGQVLASSSYDGTVRIWSIYQEASCLSVFNEPGHFVRCISFIGDKIASGDFGGNIHVWDVQPLPDCGRVNVRGHRQFKAHKGHVVCIQMNARRIVSGSRDKTTLIQDFWAKMLAGEGRRSKAKSDRQGTSTTSLGSSSRFLGASYRPSRYLRRY